MSQDHGQLPGTTRSVVTVSLLIALLAAGLVWGWRAVTEPVPSEETAAVCEPTDLAEGEELRTEQVLINVLNASTRDGLATRTMQGFTDAGFVAGYRGNAPRGTRVSRVQIWADDPQSPDVRLVRSYLGPKVKVVDGPTTLEGVVVVVGNRFDDLLDGKRKAPVRQAATVCIPPDPGLNPDPELDPEL